VDLVIGCGEWLAIQGRTGHGTTTLLNLLGGLDRPTEGTVELDGTGPGALRETQLTRLRAEKIGFIFQAFNLIPTLSAAENVEAALIPLGISSAGRRRKSAAALDAVGLADRANHLPTGLSGGQQQRVAIARALGERAQGGAGRRAHRQPRRGHPRRHHRPAGEAVARARLTLVLVTHDTRIARRAQRTGVMTNGHLTIRQDSTNR
jgi:putative ABC transport system ATP-binding protein